MSNEIKNYELSQEFEGGQTIESADLSVERAIAKNQLTRRIAAFEGLMAVNTFSGSEAKVPRPKKITSLRKQLSRINDARLQSENNLNQKAQDLSQEYGISSDIARQIVNIATVFSEDLIDKGLTYKVRA